MSKLFKLSALAAAFAFVGAAHADPAETKGGIKIKTDDGRFEATVGGRIHFDAYLFDNDTSGTLTGAGTSSVQTEQGGFAFRRTYLTLTGKLYGWKYKFENDFAAGASPGSYREMWVSTTLGAGDLTIGQFKPYRGMEELTSSNDITLIERPWTTATGIYAGRQFLMGVGYKGLVADQFGYAVHAMGLGAANTTNEGTSIGGRLFWAPMADEGNTLHLGLSTSVDSRDTGSIAPATSAPYAGRRGPTAALGTAGAVACGGAAPAPACSATTNTDRSQSTVALEAAYAFGPVTLQAEYAMAKLDNTHMVGSVQTDSDVNAFYLQASWFITGEMTKYSKDRGAFGKPKSFNNESGAWELVARMDMAENADQSATANASGVAGSKAEAQTLTIGANWYVNPNVRFMLNYYTGEMNRGGILATDPDRKDSPKAITLRTQLSF